MIMNAAYKYNILVSKQSNNSHNIVEKRFVTIQLRLNKMSPSGQWRMVMVVTLETIERYDCNTRAVGVWDKINNDVTVITLTSSGVNNTRVWPDLMHTLPAGDFT